MQKHKLSIIGLIFLNFISFAGGIITQTIILKNKDFVSIIPVPLGVTLTSWQILMINFTAVVLIISLICLAVTHLVTDAMYSFGEIISNCAGVFLVIPVITFLLAIFNAVNTPELADKISIIFGAALHILLSVISVGCTLTINEDKNL